MADNEDMFAPFVEDDQSLPGYLARMKKVCVLTIASSLIT